MVDYGFERLQKRSHHAGKLGSNGTQHAIEQTGKGIRFFAQIVQRIRQQAAGQGEPVEIVAQRLEIIGKRVKIAGAVACILMQAVQHALQIFQVIVHLPKALLICRHVLRALLQRPQHTVNRRIQRRQGGFGRAQFGEQRIRPARQLLQRGQRRVGLRVERASVGDQLLAHIVQARNASGQHIQPTLHGLHGFQHTAETFIQAVARIAQTVLNIAQVGQNIERGQGCRRHEQQQPHAFKRIRSNAHGKRVFLPGQPHKYDQLVSAHGLYLRARRFNRESFAHIDSRAADQHHIIFVILARRFIRHSMDIDLHQPARARALFRFDRYTVELVGHIKIPRQLDRSITAGDALVIKPLHPLPFQRPRNRTVLQNRLVIGGHVVDLGVVAVVRERGMAVQSHPLDDTGLIGDTVVVQIDINCFVGLDFGRGCNRRLRQRKRQHQRRRCRPA